MNAADAAKLTILYHAGLVDDSARTYPELVATFRPFNGLYEESFAELIFAIYTISSDMIRESSIDQKFVFSLWWICDRARVLVLDPDSALQRSKRIDIQSLNRVKWWVDVVESFSLRALQGLDRPMCMSRLMQYFVAVPPKDVSVYKFVVSLVQESLMYDDADIAEEARQASVILQFESE